MWDSRFDTVGKEEIIGGLAVELAKTNPDFSPVKVIYDQGRLSNALDYGFV